MTYPKIAFSEMLPPGVQVDELIENLATLDDIDFPSLRYKSNQFIPSLAMPEDAPHPDELEGIILFYHRQRGRFRDDLTQEDNHSFLCQSPCGRKGYTYIGDEGVLAPKDGIDCNQCPYLPFTKKSEFRVCRKQIKLFFLKKGGCIPLTLYLDPQTTEFFMNNYIMDLTSKGLYYFKVVTKISLKNGKPDFQIKGILEGKHTEFREFFKKTMKKDNTLYEDSFKASFPFGKITKCHCNLWKGCTCGVFIREQLAIINHRNGLGY